MFVYSVKGLFIMLIRVTVVVLVRKCRFRVMLMKMELWLIFVSQGSIILMKFVSSVGLIARLVLIIVNVKYALKSIFLNWITVVYYVLCKQAFAIIMLSMDIFVNLDFIKTLTTFPVHPV